MSLSDFGQTSSSPTIGCTSTGGFGTIQSASPFSLGASSSPASGSMVSAFVASSVPAFASSFPVCGSSVIGGFGSTENQANSFGITNPQSQPAFASSIFDSSRPFGATSQSIFGTTSTPAFGSTSAPAFGATSTSAFGCTSTPTFGATSYPAFGASSAAAFSSTLMLAFSNAGSAFGATSYQAFSASSAPAFSSTSTQASASAGSAFCVSTAPAFGSGGAFGTTCNPALDSSSTSAFGASSTPAFGAWSAPAFLASSSPAFGGSSSPTFGFGSSPSFSQSSSALGSSPCGVQYKTPTFGDAGFGKNSLPLVAGGSKDDEKIAVEMGAETLLEHVKLPSEFPEGIMQTENAEATERERGAPLEGAGGSDLGEGAGIESNLKAPRTRTESEEESPVTVPVLEEIQTDVLEDFQDAANFISGLSGEMVEHDGMEVDKDLKPVLDRIFKEHPSSLGLLQCKTAKARRFLCSHLGELIYILDGINCANADRDVLTYALMLWDEVKWSGLDLEWLKPAIQDCRRLRHHTQAARKLEDLKRRREILGPEKEQYARLLDEILGRICDLDTVIAEESDALKRLNVWGLGDNYKLSAHFFK